MIRVIGTLSCIKCKRVTQTLKRNDITFSYELIQEIDEENAKRYKNEAIDAGQQNFPIIFKEGEIVNLEEVINIDK